MSKFLQLLNSVQAGDQLGRYSVEIDAAWMQGRTTFGGLTAALIIHAIQQQVPADRALRSLSVSFIGPVPVGAHEIRIRTLREGGSVSHYHGEMVCDGEVTASLSAAFGKSRDSRLSVSGPRMPNVPRPAELQPMPNNPNALGFLTLFDLRFVSGAPPFSNAEKPDFSLWLSFLEDTPSTLAAIVALADVPPMPGINMLRPAGAGSSLSWYLEFPNPVVDSEAGDSSAWLFYDYRAQSAADGYFHNYATVWSENGTPILYSRQVATLFEK
jgi:acyl-CoA thioesterase